MSGPSGVGSSKIKTIVVRPVGEPQPPRAKLLPIESTEQVVAAVGKSAVSHIPNPGKRVLRAEATTTEQDERKVKRIYMDPAALELIGSGGAEIATPHGKAQSIKAVETFKYFAESGFSSSEIAAALATVPCEGVDEAGYTGFLLRIGCSEESVERAGKSGMLTVLANLYLADYSHTFSHEIAHIREMWSCEMAEVEQLILDGYFLSTVRYQFPQEVLVSCQFALNAKLEIQKTYLRRNHYSEKQIREVQQNLSLDATVSSLIANELSSSQAKVELVETIITDRRVVEEMVCNGNFHTFHQNLQKHYKDLKCLLRAGVPLDALVGVLIKSDYLPELCELALLKFGPAVDLQAIQEGRLASHLRRDATAWLEQRTSYTSILLRTVKHPLKGRCLELSNGESFQLGRKTLELIFSRAAKAMRATNSSTKVIVPPARVGIPGAFLAILSPTNSQLNLFYWTGRLDETLGGSKRRLGGGGCAVVQEVEDLATGQVMALKARKINALPEEKEGFKRDIQNEWCAMQALQKMAGATALLIKKPYKYVEDGELVGYLMHKYSSDLYEYVFSPDARSMMMGDLYVGLLNVLETMSLLHQNQIAHGDIKMENVFVDEEEGRARLVLGDFGLAAKYQDILASQPIARGTPGTFLPSDELHFQKLALMPDSTQEQELLLEKKEVYTFGTMLLMLLTMNDWARPSEVKDLRTNIRAVYGDNVYKILIEMLSANPVLRPTIAEAIDAFKAILNDPTPEGQQRLQAMLNAQDQRLASHYDVTEIEKHTSLEALQVIDSERLLPQWEEWRFKQRSAT